MQQMPRMGKTEEDWNGLKLGFLKTVQPNSFSKFISAVCNFKNNAQETHFFVLNLWFSHLYVISLLTLSSIAIEGHGLDGRDTAPLNWPLEKSDTLYNKKGTDKDKQTGEKTEHILSFLYNHYWPYHWQ